VQKVGLNNPENILKTAERDTDILFYYLK